MASLPTIFMTMRIIPLANMRTFIKIGVMLVALQSFALVNCTNETLATTITPATFITTTMTTESPSSTETIVTAAPIIPSSTATMTTTTTMKTPTSTTTESLPPSDAPSSPALDKNIATKSDSSTEAGSETIAELDDETKVKVREKLLSIFNMPKRPDPIDRSKIVIPDQMKQLYAELMGDELQESVHLPRPGLLTKTANTVRSFVHEEGKIDDRFVHHHRFRLYFNVSNIPASEVLKAAELELFRDPILNGTTKKHKIFVYDIVRPGIKGKTEPILYLIDTKIVHVNSSEAIGLDVMPAVDRWLRNPKANYGVLIQVAIGHGNDAPAQQHIRLRRSAHEPVDEWAKKQPILMTYTDDGHYKQSKSRNFRRKTQDTERRQRAKNKTKANKKQKGHKNLDNGRLRRAKNEANMKRKGREICQRKSMRVNFDLLNLGDWIIAPASYNAFYCHGECSFPFADHLNTTNHAVVQTVVHSINSELAPKACCVPTRLRPINMLIRDENDRYVVKIYQDMEVAACGCR